MYYGIYTDCNKDQPLIVGVNSSRKRLIKMIEEKCGGTELIKYVDEDNDNKENDENDRHINVSDVEDEHIITYTPTSEQFKNFIKDNTLMNCPGCDPQISIFKSSSKCVDLIKVLSKVHIM
jgi:hypothetical protein